jgi:hypothetical protein
MSAGPERMRDMIDGQYVPWPRHTGLSVAATVTVTPSGDRL